MQSFSSFTSTASFVSSPACNRQDHSSSISEPQGLKPDLIVVGSKCDTDFIGVLEVYIHQARDIHNICIYHNQDVYAKFCLTSSPDCIVSSRIVNGGGRNPIFNEKLLLNVQHIDSSLKCEIWMLSRLKNVLEDQLLGFALVPISAVASANGGLSQEFSLSSTDLFHSPAGFVRLSLCYRGYVPVTVTSDIGPVSTITDETWVDSDTNSSISNDYAKIEFPDLQTANENERMVSECFVMAHSYLDSKSSGSFMNSSCKNHLESEIGSQVVDSFSSNADSNSVKDKSSPQNSLMNGSCSHEQACPPKYAEKIDVWETKSAGGSSKETYIQPMININVPEQSVVQQKIVDLYMKSMQEFTESLAKMKLPMDMASSEDSPQSANSSSGAKSEASKMVGTRVFYGSRAFF